MASASIKYSDTTDRAFGLCGMALALYIFDSDRYLDTLRLDAPADMGLALTPDFFIASNQNISAKGVWKADFRNFQIVSAMMIANLLSRSMSRRSADLSTPVRNLLFDMLHREGAESCGLESDEVDQLCDRTFSYLRRVFLHPSVDDAVKQMARSLQSARSLGRESVMEFLLPLNSI